MDEAATRLDEIKNDLARFPAPVSEEFEKAHTLMREALNGPQTVAWAEAGIEIAEQTVRSWEASAQFYRTSPKVVGSKW